MNLIGLAESGYLPDHLIRIGIRNLLRQRLRFSSDRQQSTEEFAAALCDSPLAIATDAANQQHYEVPAEFFEHVLGPRLKYSCCLIDSLDTSLAQAEEAMLDLTCQRAELRDGQRILELGCGWGSLTLWMAQRFPNSEITAVSNSSSQRQFIEQRARSQQLSNLQVITADMRSFEHLEVYDRVVSVEMFEHMRNYQLLLRRVSNWLHPDGKAFVHIFCHRRTPYLFETAGQSNWMGRHFFTGGMMPSEDLLSKFADDLTITSQHRVNGLHYGRTSEAWLENLDQNHAALQLRFEQDMPRREASRTLQRWRIFFMACSELFRYHDGNEWFVGHYLMTRSTSEVKSRSCERQPLERTTI